MKRSLPLVAALLAFTAVMAQAGEMTLYQKSDFGGRQLTLRAQTRDVSNTGFNDRASSIVVHFGRWEVCTDSDFGGYCATFTQGVYRRLDNRLDARISSARVVGEEIRYERSGGSGEGSNAGDIRAVRIAQEAIELFGYSDFRGAHFQSHEDVANLTHHNFNKGAASVVVYSGRWELCTDAEFAGRCTIFEPGRYGNLRELNNQISSLRRIR